MPQTTSSPPVARETFSPPGTTFSARTNAARAAIHTRFITPSTNSKVISIQQQPRQYLPCTRPIFNVNTPEDVEKFSNGQPHSTPDLEFIINLWNKSVKVVKKSLSEVTDLDLETKITWVNKNKNWDVNQDEKINLGTDLARYLFHHWNHLGEIASVRQLLGKDPGNPGYGKWDWRY